MKEGFQIGRTDGRIYAMGVTAVAGGMHFSYASKGKSCALLLSMRLSLKQAIYGNPYSI